MCLWCLRLSSVVVQHPCPDKFSIMSVYTLDALKELRNSELVSKPEFAFEEFVPQSSGDRETYKLSAQKRAPVVPKAAIPFSQRALFDSNATPAGQEENEIEGEAEDDEFAARYLLKNKDKHKTKKSTDVDGQPVINLSYAAALAASMKMSEASASNDTEAVAQDDEDGWTSVTQTKPRKNRNRSFGAWR